MTFQETLNKERYLFQCSSKDWHGGSSSSSTQTIPTVWDMVTGNSSKWQPCQLGYANRWPFDLIETYFVQFFPNFQNLASKLTYEVAPQSTEAVAKTSILSLIFASNSDNWYLGQSEFLKLKNSSKKRNFTTRYLVDLTYQMCGFISDSYYLFLFHFFRCFHGKV